MKSINLILLSSVAMMACSCATARLSSFSAVNVPGEDSCRFIRVTTRPQKIVAPDIITDSRHILWNTGSLFDVSPDGENIVYVAETDADGEKAVFVKSLRADSLPVRRSFNIDAAGPRFSPDGSSICFSGTNAGQRGSDICIIDTYNGDAIRHLTNRSGVYDAAPVFTSIGDEIIFTRGMPVETVKGSSVTITREYSLWSAGLAYPFIMQYGAGSSPEYLFDYKILYTKTNTTTFQGEIWRYDLISGSDSMLVCGFSSGYSTPRVSPDGTMVLCTGLTLDNKGRPSNLDIYLFNIDGTGLRQLTFHPGMDVSPCWSADGNTIYFMSQRGNDKGEYGIWSVSLAEILKKE